MAMTAPPARRWVSALIAPWSVLSRPLRYGSTGSSLRPVPEVLTKRVSNVLRRSCAPGAPGWCAGRGDRLTLCEVRLASREQSRRDNSELQYRSFKHFQLAGLTVHPASAVKRVGRAEV